MGTYSQQRQWNTLIVLQFVTYKLLGPAQMRLLMSKYRASPVVRALHRNDQTSSQLAQETTPDAVAAVAWNVATLLLLDGMAIAKRRIVPPSVLWIHPITNSAEFPDYLGLAQN